jgi:hypothetical protein
MPTITDIPGVVDCREVYRGRSRSASVDGVPTYVRIFLVTTNTLSPNLQNIAKAPKIDWRATHPDDTNARLVESSTQQDGDSPFHYKVTYTYKFVDESELIPWNRPSQFSFNGSLVSAPAFWHYPTETDNETRAIIVNSAKEALGGLDRDEGDFTVTIQKNIPPPFPYVMAQKYVGAINSDAWSGGAAKTWKCQSITASRKFEVVANQTPTLPPVKIEYWEVSASLAYRKSGWDLRTWDIGFNELVNGERVPIKGADGENCQEPQALFSPPLATAGQKKPAGQPPNEIVFRIYAKETFTGVFPVLPGTATSVVGFTYPTWVNLLTK